MHVRVNAATSVDGKLSTHEREQLPISGPADFERVDRLRAEADAIMVGVGTVLADDPSLTLDADSETGTGAHGEEGPVTDGGESTEDESENADAGESDDPAAASDSIQSTGVDDGVPGATGANPARVVADSRIRTPPDATVLDDSAPTYLLVSEAAPTDFVEEMEASGATVIPAGEDQVDLTTGLAKLEGEGVEELLVEGGGELIFSLFEAGLVDELSVFVGPLVIGGRDAPTLADGDGFLDEFPELTLDDVERLDDGLVTHWTVD